MSSLGAAKNGLKGNVGETSERQGGAYNYRFSRAYRYHLEVNWTELTRRIQHTLCITQSAKGTRFKISDWRGLTQ